MTKAEEFLINYKLEYITLNGVDVPTFKSTAEAMEAYLQSRIPSPEAMRARCEEELQTEGEYPTGGYSVRSPKNFYRTGFQTCWQWIHEHVRKG